ncbi:serine/threonine protein phosphatase [Rubidibacter lacunae KORDI 51-2]|uniref:Serine/threonine protein phosphatase n=1 Tax=Rubidibacter lacunae KORDI 51-2 TaxID=582515 RepID=U5DMS2_9CHRO|nr:PP2C family serine/threonine-protein phosphatase [Rubidibacter lacunae]ERN42976.1 serine/threonine protein phosphatase [Rubidibacter lacunae KORDI 51-2]
MTVSSRSLQSPTPLLWASGDPAASIPPGTIVASRFRVAHQRVWHDLQPAQLPLAPVPLPKDLQCYARAYEQNLHLPQIYDICLLETGDRVVLLDNPPLDARGELLPSLQAAWPKATALRQLNWLWQMLELWPLLAALGVADSLLQFDNVRVADGRVRLLELLPATGAATQKQLGIVWATLAPKARPAISPQLSFIAAQLQRSQAERDSAIASLNSLLLAATARQPRTWEVSVLTDTGRFPRHNQDSCYPLGHFRSDAASPNELQATDSILVCDGIGGHDGGEIASQLAVQSLKLQIDKLLVETARNPSAQMPTAIARQIATTVRVTNNSIVARNNAQNRHARSRMATTLVMAVQVKQHLAEDGNPAHEVYLAHVGDSRAYWLTARRCCQLTVDDDMATQYILNSRLLPRTAIQRVRLRALSQAIGIADASGLRPTVRRLIVDEDGLLLLCSDGLSDYQFLEESWHEFAPAVLRDELSLASATRLAMKLANDRNGHDNITLAIARYRLGPRRRI